MDERLSFYVIQGLLLAFIIFYFVLISQYLVSLVVSWRRLYCKLDVDTEDAKFTQGVSIIKPLMGVDPCLMENLESHFQLKYPFFELLFCFHSENDPAIEIVNKLMVKYPKVDCHKFFTEEHHVINPMIQNMLPAYNNAKFDFLWISTSRIKVSTEILLDMINRATPANVGLVHQMPFISTPQLEITHSQSVIQAIEKIYFGSSLARHFLFADLIDYGLFCGMSYVTKKSALAEFGGFPELGKFLAEDFFLQKLIQARGYKTRLCTYPAQQNMLTQGLEAYKDRLVRWTRLRIQIAPLITLFVEPITNAISQGIIISFAFHTLFAIHPIIFLPLHLLLWIYLDWKFVCSIEGKPVDIALPIFLCAWLIRELMVYYVLFESLLNPFTIRWGRGKYRVTCGGHTVKLSASPISSA